MIPSFYTAGTGVKAQQTKMDLLANNLANINTTGFKTKNPVFSELTYLNFQDAVEGHLQNGKGAKVARGNAVLHESGGMQQTGGNLDFMINGTGFFALSDLEGEVTRYTRDGRFMISNLDDTMYLTNSSGLLVLNAEGEPIEMEELTEGASMDQLNIGVFQIPIEDGMVEDGFNNYLLTEKNGEPEALEGADIMRGYLETSNVDMAKTFADVIEAQRAYSLTLKMLQAADEIEQDINTMRR